jgi:hypothetical protein
MCVRNVEKDPYSKTEVFIPLFLMAFLCLAIFVTCIPGLIYAPDIEDGVNLIECSFFAGVGDIVLGANNELVAKEWFGL